MRQALTTQGVAINQLTIIGRQAGALAQCQAIERGQEVGIDLKLLGIEIKGHDNFGLRQGYFMNLYFQGNRLAGMEPVFTWIDEKFRPVPATPAQAREIKSAIYSDDLLYK